MAIDESWEPEREEYSPDRFYTRATDRHGHSELVHLKLPPDTAAAIAQIVQSRRIPEYRTAQDLIRDAVFHRLRYLRDSGLVDGVAGTLIELEEFAHEMHEFHRRKKAFEEVIRQAEETVRELGWNTEEAKKIARGLYAKALAVQDSEYWRNKYVEEIERRFKPLLED